MLSDPFALWQDARLSTFDVSPAAGRNFTVAVMLAARRSKGERSNIHVGLAATTPHDGLHTRLPLLDKSGCTFLPNTHCAGCPGRLAARVVAPLQGSMLSLGPSIVYRQYCPLHRQADAEGFGREVATPSAPCGRWRWMLLLSDVYSTIHIDNNTYCGIYEYMTIYLYCLFLLFFYVSKIKNRGCGCAPSQSPINTGDESENAPQPNDGVILLYIYFFGCGRFTV